MPQSTRLLRILHVFRTPVGGLFRHVIDVARGQVERGHSVGIVCDSLTGGAHADRILGEVSGLLAFGVSRIPMGRQIGMGDISATRHVASRIAEMSADVVHGHGAKGAAYARLAQSAHPHIRVYTPHGGSLLFNPATVNGCFYISLEKILKHKTDLFLFESSFAARLFREKVGHTDKPAVVVPNGVGKAEFEPVPLAADATDLLYIGELRHLKGVDLLLNAIAELRRNGQMLTATIVGDGDSRQELQAQARSLGLADVVRFHMPMPAREAFALGRISVVPSRAESLPYIVLEIAAAGRPLIVTNVGSIADIFGSQADLLIEPDNEPALTKAISDTINHPETMLERARLLQQRVATTFSIDEMVDGGIAAYRDALARLKS